MEGREGVLRWRLAGLVAAALLCVSLVGPTGCGDGTSDSGSVRTSDPVATFAPLVMLHPAELWFPSPVGSYLEHVSLWWADDENCPHAKIASKAALRVDALGRGDFYEHPRTRRDCRPIPSVTFTPSDLTRPHHTGAGRERSLDWGEGFYMEADPGDWRTGWRPGYDRLIKPDVPAYYETARERVNGDPGLRIAYWFFYPSSGSTWLEWWDQGEGEPRTWGRDRIHRTGDWERVDVLLRRSGAGGYAPDSVRLYVDDRRRLVAWDDVELSGATHPRLYAALGSHTFYLHAGFHQTVSHRLNGNYVIVDDTATCVGCARWRTWHRLRDARDEPWYGYGGAWGAEGFASSTTGALGPR